jgi:hypothetical protein
LTIYRDKLSFYEEWTLGEKDDGITRDDMRLLFAEDPDFVNDLNSKQHRLPLIWFVENIDEVFSEFMERNIEIADALRTEYRRSCKIELDSFSLADLSFLFYSDRKESTGFIFDAFHA